MNEPTEHDSSQDNILEVVARTLPPDDTLRPETTGISLDSHLESDLGLDSLTRAELLVNAERHFGVQLPETLLNSAQTPRDILHAVARERGEEPAEPSITEASREHVNVPSFETLQEALLWHAHKHPQRNSLHWLISDSDVRPLSFGDLHTGSLRVANGLFRHNLQLRDTVALMLPTGHDYFYSFFGTLYANAIPVPLAPPSDVAQLEEHLRREAAILNKAQVRVMITVPEAKRLATVIKALVPSLEHVLTPGDLWGNTLMHPLASASGEQTALLKYTSGSGDNPEAVRFSHANLSANIRAETITPVDRLAENRFALTSPGAAPSRLDKAVPVWRQKAVLAWRQIRRNLYAGWAWFAFGLTGVLTLLGVNMLPRPTWRWQVLHFGGRVLGWVTGTRLTMKGAEKLKTLPEGCVVVANHVSYVDALVIAALMPVPVSFVAKAELRRFAFLRRLFRLIDVEAVDRSTDESKVRTSRRIARRARGRRLIYFAEGSFDAAPGIQPFHMGAFMTAAVAHQPVLPIALKGTREKLPADRWNPRPGPIEVVVGELIWPHSDDWGSATQLREQTRKAIITLSGEPDRLAHPHYGPPAPAGDSGNASFTDVTNPV